MPLIKISKEEIVAANTTLTTGIESVQLNPEDSKFDTTTLPSKEDISQTYMNIKDVVGKINELAQRNTKMTMEATEVLEELDTHLGEEMQ